MSGPAHDASGWSTPEFPDDLEWSNTPRPVSLAGLRGRFVLLEFFATGSERCRSDAIELARLSDEFERQLVVVGIHSPKFDDERAPGHLDRALGRLGIRFPVGHDPELRTWRLFGVEAWPTSILIGPDGRILAAQPGEISADELSPVLTTLIAQERLVGRLTAPPIDLDPPLETTGRPATGLLAYPSKVEPGPDGLLYIADTGHDRILEVALDPARPVGRIERIFASGFDRPRGLSVAGDVLYVADTGNHALRAIDRPSGAVRTVGGTGRRATGRQTGATSPTTTALRSPWDVLRQGEVLFVAMAGSHQIWVLIGEHDLGPFAGAGPEALVDGPRQTACFGQPSGLALGLGHLFVADAEASAVRAVGLDDSATVLTLAGRGLLESGDVDGTGDEVRLQHPTDVAVLEPEVYIADGYNHKIKVLDPTTGRVRTVAGTGRPGSSDGDLDEAEFANPEGLAALGPGRLVVADTDNHLVRIVDLAAGRVETLEISR